MKWILYCFVCVKPVESGSKDLTHWPEFDEVLKGIHVFY